MEKRRENQFGCDEEKEEEVKKLSTRTVQKDINGKTAFYMHFFSACFVWNSTCGLQREVNCRLIWTRQTLSGE